MVDNKLKKEYSVGEHYFTASGDEYVISGKWVHDKHIDYQTINCKTKEEGSFRITN